MFTHHQYVIRVISDNSDNLAPYKVTDYMVSSNPVRVLHFKNGSNDRD